jgi:integrase
MPSEQLRKNQVEKYLKTPPPTRKRYSDGKGLYLQMTPTGGASWVYQYSLRKRIRWMSLGPAETMTLEEAREAHHEARRLQKRGVDPIEARGGARALQRPVTVTGKADRAQSVTVTESKSHGPTFQQAAEQYLLTNRRDWGEAQDRDHRSRLKLHIYPAIGNLPVEAITTADIKKLLEPIWTGNGHGRGSKTRALIQAILNAQEGLQQPTVAAWSRLKGKLHTRPPETKHYTAMPYAQVPALMKRLAADGSMRAQALQLATLTALRIENVVGARWEEIGDKVWRIPANRMKLPREHCVPLTQPMLDVLGPRQPSGPVFPSHSKKGTLTRSAVDRLITALGLRGEATIHGMRSAFTDYAYQVAKAEKQVIELSLAHLEGKVPESYGDVALFKIDERRELFEAWNRFCVGA